jgi:hypothetical protein
LRQPLPQIRHEPPDKIPFGQIEGFNGRMRPVESGKYLPKINGSLSDFQYPPDIPPNEVSEGNEFEFTDHLELICLTENSTSGLGYIRRVST